MWSRSLILTALAVYLGVVGCAIWPAGAGRSQAAGGDEGDDSHLDVSHAPATGPAAPAGPRGRKLVGLPYRGVAMQIQKVDKLAEYEQGIDEIAALGADTVSIVVDCRQENGSSSRIFMDLRMTPSPQALARLIKHAKSRNLRVVLMPIVLLDNPRGNEWRGTINPEVWADWFDSYRAVIQHYAEVAQLGGVDLFVVGSELVSTESKLGEWTKTIRLVRKIYKGQITYSSNWDHYRAVPFWDQLDLIGMNSYWNLGRIGNRTLERREITPDTIRQRWAEIQQDLFAFQKSHGKPLILLEVGWCSVGNAAHEPWDYTIASVPLDTDLQRKLYEGFFRSWWGNPALGGFMIWEWPPGRGGPDDRGYTPEGKPAERVMREWFGKREWKPVP